MVRKTSVHISFVTRKEFKNGCTIDNVLDRIMFFESRGYKLVDPEERDQISCQPLKPKDLYLKNLFPNTTAQEPDVYGKDIPQGTLAVLAKITLTITET